MEKIKNLFSGIIGTKPLLIVIATLSILLSSSLFLNYHQDKKIGDLQQELGGVYQINVRLNKEIAKLTEDLQKKPKEIIKTVTEVNKELCEGEKKTSEIMHFKPSMVNRKEDTNEKEYVDIDTPFSAEFISLLK